MTCISKRELLKAGAAGLAAGELFFGLSPLATGSITALAQTPKRGGVVRAVVHPEPSSLMLGLVQNTPTQMVAGSIYESLLKYGHDLKPIPSLAERWEISEDGKAYTFHLKRNVTWHDGKPFTADDVVFSTDVFLRELHPRWRPVATTHVERIEKLDDFTVRYQLKNPFGPFILMFELSTTPIVPKHLYAGTDYKTNPNNNTPVGTGPFKLAEWTRGSHIKLVRNPDYHVQGLPYLDEIYWQIIPDAAARVVAYETGAVDILTGGTVENFDVAKLAKMKNTAVTGKGWEMIAPLSWLWFNHRQGLMAKKSFRQAVMYGMDREFAKDVIWNGLARLATGPVSSKTRFYSDKVAAYGFDPAKAKALLKESGYKGEPIRLLALPYGEAWTRWAEAVKQNLTDIGMTVQLVTTDVAGYGQRLSDWDFDLAFTWLSQFGDPALGVARTYVSSNIAKGSPWNNVAGYSNPEVDRLFAEAAAANGDAARQELYTKVQQILVDDLPVAWMLELEFPTIYRSNFNNLIKTATGMNDAFQDAWKA